MRLALTLLLLSSPAFAGTVVFERVEPVEVRTGVVRLCSVQAPLLEVPDLEARPSRPGAWREDRFARLYTVDFQLETRRRGGIEEEDRGALLLAVRTGSQELLALDERLRSLLLSLGPDAFVRPLAGIEENAPDFLNLAEISTEPSWACSRRGGRGSIGSATMYSRKTERSPGEQVRVIGTSTASFSEENQARSVCETFLEAAHGCLSEEIRSLAVPRELHEWRVEMDEASTLPRELARDDVPPLPQGVERSKKTVPGTMMGTSLSADGSQGSYIDREVEWAVRTAPSSIPLDLLAHGAHVSRWKITERQRRFGVLPRNDETVTAMRTVAFVPLPPLAAPDERPAPLFPVELNAELFREDIGHVLDAASTLDGDVLELALRGGSGAGPQWLRSEGWLMVVCREDGTAWFGLPPTAAWNVVTNAALICAAMERMLPSP